MVGDIKFFCIVDSSWAFLRLCICMLKKNLHCMVVIIWCFLSSFIENFLFAGVVFSLLTKTIDISMVFHMAEFKDL